MFKNLILWHTPWKSTWQLMMVNDGWTPRSLDGALLKSSEIMIPVLHKDYRFAQFVLKSFKPRKTPSWSDVIKDFWLQSDGQRRKSFLPTKLVGKKWRGSAGKRKAKVVEFGFTLSSDTIPGHFLQCRGVSSPRNFSGRVEGASIHFWHSALPTPSNLLLGPHLQDMLKALNLSSSTTRRERKWYLSRLITKPKRNNES